MFIAVQLTLALTHTIFGVGGTTGREMVVVGHSNNNNNNVHLSCAHQCPERSHDTY